MSKKRKKLGAWITYQYDDSPSTCDGFISFGVLPIDDDTDEDSLDSNGIPDFAIFYYCQESEIKHALKTGETMDEFKVIAIHYYLYEDEFTGNPALPAFFIPKPKQK